MVSVTNSPTWGRPREDYKQQTTTTAVSMSTMDNNSVRAKLIASALNSANGANHNNNGLKKIQQNIIVIN